MSDWDDESDGDDGYYGGGGGGGRYRKIHYLDVSEVRTLDDTATV